MKNKFILFILLIATLSASGCIESPEYRPKPTENSYQAPVQQQDYTNYDKIIDDYEKYAETFESDAEMILSIADQFGMNDKIIVQNNEVTLEDIYLLTNIIEEYNYEYRKVHSHLESQMNFINRNQNDLEKLGVDVFTYKQILSDFDIDLQNQQDRMISRTEYYIDYLALQEEYSRQQKEQLEDLLNLLVMFV